MKKCNVNKNVIDLMRPNICFSIGYHRFKLKTLIDSGATHSFIKLSALPENLQHSIRKFKSSSNYANTYGFKRLSIEIESAVGQSEMECTVIYANVQLNDWYGSHEFIVSEQITEDALIGLDFLQKHSFKIDFAKNQIAFENDNAEQLFYASNNINIKPLSEQIIKVKTTKRLAKQVVVASPINSNKNLKLAHSVNYTNRKGELYVSILNHSNRTIKVHKNQILGTTSKPEQVESINPDELRANETKLREHLAQSVKMGSDLNASERSQLINLLIKYKEIISLDKFDLGLCNEVEHRINTGQHEPFKLPAYKTSLKQKQQIENEINALLENNLIEQSNSPWSSPVVLIKKKDQSIRFCVDFRKLNALTTKDAYPLPRIEEIIEAVGSAKHFSTLDLASGYWQVPLKHEDAIKTAFATHKGLFHFTVLPFGLSNAPGTFQRLMDRVLAKLTWSKCLVYLDDIIVFGNSLEQHLSRLEAVFQCLKKANLKIKLSKCDFIQKEVVYLGFKLTSEGIKPSDDKVKAITKMPNPKSTKEVKRFIGMCTYYKQHIPLFAQIATPLYNLTHKNTKFIWSDQCDRAFHQLKSALTNSPLLAYVNPYGTFIIECDASIEAIGAVLSQEPERKPIAYASRRLYQHERSYSNTDREALAIVWSVKHFKSLIYGHKVIIYTDHQALVTERKFKDPDSNHAKMILKIQHIDHTIKYKRGKLNANADMLSRLKSNDEETRSSNEQTEDSNKPLPEVVKLKSIEVKPISWADEQDKDDELKELKELVKSNSDLKTLAKSNFYFKERNNVVVDRNILFKVSNKPTRNRRIVVPSHKKEELIELAHHHELSGHRGLNKTIEKLRSSYYWPNMEDDINENIKRCHICQVKKQHFKPKANLIPMEYHKPFEMIGIDIVGVLPETKTNSNQYIICAIDYFSKYAITRAIKDLTALTAAKFIFEDIICVYGTPKKIITDRGSNFESSLIKNLCSLMKIDKLRTTAYHPQCNGEVERLNQTLKGMLTCFVDKRHDDWDEYLPQCTFAYNTQVHDSTKISPYEVLFGRTEPNFFNNNNDTINITPNSYLDELTKAQAKINQAINNNIQTARAKQQKYQKSNELYSYNVGDRVLLDKHTVDSNQCRKFRDQYWPNVFKIIQVEHPNYKIQNTETNEEQRVHYNRIKPYNSKQTEQTEQAKQPEQTEQAKPVEQIKSKEPIKLEISNENIYNLDDSHAIVIFTSADEKFKSKVERDLKELFPLGKLRLEANTAAHIMSNNKNIFLLVAKQNSSNKMTYQAIEKCLIDLKQKCQNLKISQLAITNIKANYDDLKWGRIAIKIEEIFQDTEIKIKICSKSNTNKANAKTSSNSNQQPGVKAAKTVAKPIWR